MEREESSRRVGRPRGFRNDEVLDQAMRVFWAKGFEGASISDLTAATGLKPASIYAAFGNKEALFQKALDRYLAGPLAFMRRALDAPTACGVVEGVLRGTAEFLTRPNQPAGCMTVQTSLACNEETQPVRELLVHLRRGWQDSLKQRFEKAQADGDLPSTEDAGDLAGFVAAMVQGMAVQAASGARLDELLRVSEMALRAWPR